MDRDTIRIVLLVTGVLVVIGMYVWGRHKQQLMDFLQRRGEYDELGYDDTREAAAAPSDEEDEFESLGYKPRQKDKHAAPAYGFEDDLDEELFADPKPPSAKPAAAPAPEQARKAAGISPPILIQVSIVAAGQDRFFQGEDLREALLDLDLIHGSMGIFHRYDRKFKESLFSIASLVEPGTFPMDDMESFETPGIIMFFQPDQVDNPLAVFDDLIRTSHKLANRLGGIEWDEKRKPLSREKIAELRGLLEDACEEP